MNKQKYQLTITNIENITAPDTKGQRLKISYEYFPKSIIGSPEESTKKQFNFLNVFANETAQFIWQLNFENFNKVVFEFGKREIIRKIKEQNFNESEFNITTPNSSQEKPCISLKFDIKLPQKIDIEV